MSTANAGAAQGTAASDYRIKDWSALVERVQQNDRTALEDLYRVFAKGIRFYLCRQLGSQDLDDRVHDCFLIVVGAIQRGELREPDRLMGFVRTIVRRQIAGHIEHAVNSRRTQVDLEASMTVPDRSLDPEVEAIDRQEEEIAVNVLKGVSRRDREILTRFYIHEQSQEQICQEMRLTTTQFRLLKSRAKARFGEIGKRRLERKNASLFG